MIFDDKQFGDLLRNVVLPMDTKNIRLSPSEKIHFDDGRSVNYPSMYLDGESYYSSSEECGTLLLNINSEFDYMCCWWYNSNRFSISIIDGDNDDDDDKTIDLHDFIRIGKFHENEEEHFQEDCLRGTPITWELETLIKDTFTSINELYKIVVNNWEKVQ